MEQFLCSQIHQQHNAVFFIFSVMAVIWSDCVFSSESFQKTIKFVIRMNNNVFLRVRKRPYPRCTRSQYHNFPSQLHCHIGTGTDSITRQCCPVFSSCTTFVQLPFEDINSELLLTSVYAPDRQAHPLLWHKDKMAALWHLVSRFLFVSLYPYYTIRLHGVHGDKFIFTLQTSHIIHSYVSRSVSVPHFTSQLITDKYTRHAATWCFIFSKPITKKDVSFY